MRDAKEQRKIERDCLHFVRRIMEKPYRYQCTKCGQKQKILNGVLLKPRTEGEAAQ